MPSADGTGASSRRPGIEMVPPRDIDGPPLVGSSQPQRPVEVIVEVREQLHAPDKGRGIQDQQQPPENQQQDGADASGGGSEPDSEARQGSSSRPQQGPLAIIPKVREQLRRAADDYLFAPQIMLIGPYHEYEDYYSMEEKMKVVNQIKDVIGDGDIEGLKTMLAGLWEHEVRKCYTHLPLSDDTDPVVYSSMLLHDGCYVLSLLIDFGKHQEGERTTGNHIIEPTLVRDILYLLENQIPLFVLQRIQEHISLPSGHEKTALECISSFVEGILQQQLYISNTARPVPSESVASDLLHLVYSYFRRQPQEELTPQGRRPLAGRWRQATDYSKYGDLRFKCRVFTDEEEWTILDIHLQGGTLYIPFLRVDCYTWTMLRNLMALEEQEKKQRPVTAYCYFMSQVACTAEDVGLLQRAKILEHFLGSDEQAAEGFAELCDGMALDMDNLDRNYLKPIWHDLHQRCRTPVHNFKGFFREKYCGTLFHRLVFSIALLVFITQVMQVFYAALAYHKPPK